MIKKILQSQLIMIRDDIKRRILCDSTTERSTQRNLIILILICLICEISMNIQTGIPTISHPRTENSLQIYHKRTIALTSLKTLFKGKKRVCCIISLIFEIPNYYLIVSIKTTLLPYKRIPYPIISCNLS